MSSELVSGPLVAGGGLGFPLTLFPHLSRIFNICCDVTATRAVRRTMGFGCSLGLKEGWGVGGENACQGYEGSPRIPRDSGGNPFETNVLLLSCYCCITVL